MLTTEIKHFKLKIFYIFALSERERDTERGFVSTKFIYTPLLMARLAVAVIVVVGWLTTTATVFYFYFNFFLLRFLILFFYNSQQRVLQTKTDTTTTTKADDDNADDVMRKTNPLRGTIKNVLKTKKVKYIIVLLAGCFVCFC